MSSEVVIVFTNFQVRENGEVRENKEDLKAKLKEVLREKSDLFNSENPEEDNVCRLTL